MDTPIMARTPARVDLGQAWLHLPTGTAGIHAIAQHPDRGPIISSGINRPFVDGGATRLLEPLLDPQFTDLSDRQRWADRTTIDVEEALNRLGWTPVTRRDAAELLTALGYQLRPSTQPGHILHTDQADKRIWCDVSYRSGSIAVEQRAFVTRDRPL